GFYSSLDADSEGEEGRFYVWTLDEIRSALGGVDELFEAAYGLSINGNWEGKTVLQRELDDTALAERYSLPVENVNTRLQECHTRLLAMRSTRIRPATDDKVLTSWNGLMLATFSEAARAFGNTAYSYIAARNADFLLTALRPDGRLCRAWRMGQVSSVVFLEDYASLILGLLDLYQTDFDNRWYSEACELAEIMLRDFAETAGGFYDTPADAAIILSRPKDLQDNATPSGNALAAEALLKLAAFSDNTAWRQTAEKALDLVADLVPRYPTAFGRWLSAGDFSFSRVKQVAVVGDLADNRTQALLAEINRTYDPNRVVAASPYRADTDSPALLSGRSPVDGKPTVYVCEGYVCRQPVTTIDDLRALLA
ncbi:MAG: thioredoxin domain-containing protein, partial [Anaerolineae bacterium]